MRGDAWHIKNKNILLKICLDNSFDTLPSYAVQKQFLETQNIEDIYGDEFGRSFFVTFPEKIASNSLVFLFYFIFDFFYFLRFVLLGFVDPSFFYFIIFFFFCDRAMCLFLR